MSRVSSEIKVANLDLNLIVSLDALLQERSVSKAAARLGLSQPALSASLARLRRHFDDDLLARVGNRYELTPLAAQLVDVTASAMAGVLRVFTSAAQFDPATATREFTVVLSDYATTVLGPALAELSAEQAPGVHLRAPASPRPVSPSTSTSGCTRAGCWTTTRPTSTWPSSCAALRRWASRRCGSAPSVGRRSWSGCCRWPSPSA